LTATEANCVFIERNVHDPELGFCSRTIGVAEHSGSLAAELEYEYWDLVPWDSMPYTRRYLEKGLPAEVIPDELEGAEYDLYAVGPFPVKAELDIPIFVNGRWAGLIGLSDHTDVRRWTATDRSLLTTAAKMMGAFWEREVARDQLEEANRTKDAFLASVSHELRTPLTAVVGFGQLLKEAQHTLSAEERAELLETIVGQGTDLTNIVSDLLVAAKAGIDRLHVTSVPVDLRAQSAQVLESFEPTGVSGIELVGDSLGAVGDPDRVRQIVRNLISNALRYGGDNIRMTLSDSGAVAKVSVCDDGAALPVGDRARIFQPYQRAHNVPGLADSLGLGLAISRQLAQLMGGDLTYRHENGESIFELSLPRGA
jgi:signal transduction histidine kinase